MIEKLIESLVTNLLDNALRHNVPGGRITVTTSTVDGRARLRGRLGLRPRVGSRR